MRRTRCPAQPQERFVWNYCERYRSLSASAMNRSTAWVMSFCLLVLLPEAMRRATTASSFRTCSWVSLTVTLYVGGWRSLLDMPGV